MLVGAMKRVKNRNEIRVHFPAAFPPGFLAKKWTNIHDRLLSSGIAQYAMLPVGTGVFCATSLFWAGRLRSHVSANKRPAGAWPGRKRKYFGVALLRMRASPT